eukprot:TRINITY_DN187_c0_g1_i6.p1 TRINITY_DN187_c0_g1~~TRINITY_DN187_c0_g1_i6.p1  ORF type:complete len:236 (+),score=28.23 TRINITY_DN187_c0_g1_i6:180-887(+)
MEQPSSISCFISEQLLWRSRTSRGGAPLLVSKHPTRRFTIMPRVMCLHSAAASHKPEGLTVEEYHELIETGFLDYARGELIDGFFIQMHPQSVEHVATVSFLFRTLFKALENRAVIRDSKPITLMKLKSEPEPDIVIASGVDDDYNTRNPSQSDVLLVAEVSNSTLRKDSTIKLEEYALAGIPEYWIVDIKARNVQVLREPQGNCYEFKMTVSSGFIAPAAFPDVSIRVQSLFRS